MKKIPGKLNEVTFVEKGREGAESRQMASCIFMHACFFLIFFFSVCVLWLFKVLLFQTLFAAVEFALYIEQI